MIDDWRTLESVEGVETVHARNAFDGLAALYNEEWDEVWLDWNLRFLYYDGMYIVNEIVRRPEKPAVKHFITHSSDWVEANKMVRKLCNAGFKATYEPDIDKYITTWKE